MAWLLCLDWDDQYYLPRVKLTMIFIGFNIHLKTKTKYCRQCCTLLPKHVKLRLEIFLSWANHKCLLMAVTISTFCFELVHSYVIS